MDERLGSCRQLNNMTNDYTTHSFFKGYVKRSNILPSALFEEVPLLTTHKSVEATEKHLLLCKTQNVSLQNALHT